MISWKSSIWLLISAFILRVLAEEEAEAKSHKTTTPLVGLVGFGVSLYQPRCCAACHDVFVGAELRCSVPNPERSRGFDRHTPASGRPIHDYLTPPQCHASDTSYLTSLASCMQIHCGKAGDNVPAWKIEKFWGANVASGFEPKWTYSEALQRVQENLSRGRPRIWNRGVLNYTAATNQTKYEIIYGTWSTYEYALKMHARYGLITLLVGAFIPILLTVPKYLPWGTTLTTKLMSYLDMSIYRGYNMRILPFWLGNAPTIGQALYILSFFAINVVLSAIDYKTFQPHRMWETPWVEIMYYVAARTGVIAFSIAPLVLLLASRNNILLWLSNWSHGTFLVLHRWVGRVFTIQSVVHSIVELHLFIHRGRYPKEQSKPYWIWGILATMAAVCMLIFGVTWIRRKHYEVFLITHIVLAILVLVGSWYHVQLLYFGERGYENWLYACFAVWGADRLLRLLRVAKTGVKKSKITELSNDLVRIDIEGVRWENRPGAHAYAYFPSLSWRVWENHPFSIVHTSRIQKQKKADSIREVKSHSSSNGSMNHDSSQMEKTVGVVAPTEVTTRSVSSTAGVTLYVKKTKGMTRFLKPSLNLVTLLEGPYSDRSHEDLLLCDRLVCLAGGVGITGVLEFAARHPNAKLYWSMKQTDAPLAHDLDHATSGLTEREVRIGQRFNVRDVLEAEGNGGYKRVGVVVCGPEGLCDDVRSCVTRLGRQKKGVSFELSVEAFSW